MKNILSLGATLTLLLVITSLSVLYSEGWRVQFPFFADERNTNDNNNSNPSIIIKTGMLAVRSIPDGAKVYVDDKLITATNDTISSLNPKGYKLRVQKEGFETWEKDINVYPELVTDITAVLVSQTPKLEPLTNNEVKAFALASDYNDIVYLSPVIKDPGIWNLPLTGGPLSILRNSSRPLVKNTPTFAPSSGSNLWWSPDRKEILVELNPKGYLLYKLDNTFFNPNLNGSAIIPTQLTEKETTIKRWNEDFITNFQTPKLESIFSDLEMPELIKNNIETGKITWSPDESKFILEVPNAENPELVDLIVFNSDETLPADEKRLNTTLRGINPQNIKYSWYSDSYHLILVRNVEGRESDYTISLIRIDGSNQTPIYTGYLASDQAYTSPYGDKIIVLTSLKEGSAPNLYGIAIR